MNTKTYLIVLTCITLWFCPETAQAYRFEVSNRAMAGTFAFLAGYYGDRISVIDSVQADVEGKAVFARGYDLCPGIYTIVVPGKLTCDFLLDSGQQLKIEWISANNIRITGDETATAYAGYCAWMNTRPDKQQAFERRRQIIGLHPGTFLAAYLTALQPVEAASDIAVETGQMMKVYRYRRHHFFDNMSLSDVRLLRTPLYHETVQYYFTRFVTQQTDTLIHIAYRMLEQASGSHETFFYLSDYLIDFSLRSKIKDVHKLHNFLMRNKDMLSRKGISLLPAKSKTNYFTLSDEVALQNCLSSMPLTDTDGLDFDPETVKSKYRILYFWKNDCMRCLADVSKWQATLGKYRHKSCFGIAVNTAGDVQQHANRILDYEPLCMNVSIGDMPLCKYIFFATAYSRIILTDTDGNIIGIFGSSASLNNFLQVI